MASIEKRGKNSYRLVVEAGYDAQGKRIKRSKTVHVPKKTDAEKELAKFIVEIESGEYIAPEKMTFSTFTEKEWLTKYAEKELSPTTIKKYKAHLKTHILPIFGHRQMTDIKTIQIVTFINSLYDPEYRKDNRHGRLSDSTILDIYKTIKSVIDKAAEWRIIVKNPMDGVKQPKVERKRMKYYDADEAQTVIKALYKECSTWRLFFLGAMLGGFRRGELLGLEWTDVNFVDNTITVRQTIPLTVDGQAVLKKPKTETSERTIDMPSWYMAELREHQKESKKERLLVGDQWEGGTHNFVFHNGFGKPFGYNTPSTMWKLFTEKHGLKHIRLHDLRHTAGTLLIEAGIEDGIQSDISLKAVQERLGHKNYNTTANIYSHITKKASKVLSDKLDKFDPKKSVPKSSPTA